MYKLKNIKLTNLLGAVCAGVFVLLALMVISPSVANEVEAVTDGTVLPASVDNKQILSVSLDKNNVYFGEVTATEAGQFLTEAVNVKVSSNAEKGFKLYVNTMEATTAMNNTTTAGGEIASLSRVVTTDATGTGFPANQWGYNLVDGKDTSSFVYSPINASDHAEATSTNAPSSRDYTLNFATKLDTTLPAGTYRNNMIVSAVTDPVRILTLNDISTMQEMTSEICSNTLAANAASLPAGEKQLVTPGNEPSKQLVDTRDGKKYWVSKLADQNCWMTQNLALDIPAEPSADFISQSDNIPVGWKPSAGTRTGSLDLSGTSNTDDNSSYSWNMGENVLATPINGVACDSLPLNESDHNDGYNSVRLGQNLSQCQNIVDVSGANWTPTYTAQEGAWFSPAHNDTFNRDVYLVGSPSVSTIQTIVSVKPNDMNDLSKGGEYDPHYLVGNYYQWNAVATGSSVDTADSSSASSSICPKGWQLPLSGVVNNEVSGSFYNLLGKYGLQTSMSNETYNVATRPIYFTRAGNIDLNVNTLRRVGFVGNFWSSVLSATSQVYYLGFDNSAVSPSVLGTRWLGGSVRCLAR